ARPSLLHLYWRVEHVERTGGVQRIHQRPEQLRVHVVDLRFELHDPLVFITWGSAPHPGSVARGGPFAPLRSLAITWGSAPPGSVAGRGPFAPLRSLAITWGSAPAPGWVARRGPFAPLRSLARRGGTRAAQNPQNVRSLLRIPFAGAVRDLLDAHRRQRAELLRISGHQERARRCYQLGLTIRVHRHTREQPRGCGRRHGKHAVCAAHRTATHVQRRRHDVVDPEPLEAVHCAYDVDDRVEGAGLVKV